MCMLRTFMYICILPEQSLSVLLYFNWLLVFPLRKHKHICLFPHKAPKSACWTESVSILRVVFALFTFGIPSGLKPPACESQNNFLCTIQSKKGRQKEWWKGKSTVNVNRYVHIVIATVKVISIIYMNSCIKQGFVSIIFQKHTTSRIRDVLYDRSWYDIRRRQTNCSALEWCYTSFLFSHHFTPYYFSFVTDWPLLSTIWINIGMSFSRDTGNSIIFIPLIIIQYTLKLRFDCISLKSTTSDFFTWLLLVYFWGA